MKKIITTATLMTVLILSVLILASADSAKRPTVTSLSIESYPDKTVYGAFEQLDLTGLCLSATFTDGSVKRVLENEISISYNKDSCLRVGDKSVMLSYGGVSIKLPVTVNRIAYDISALDLNSITTTYNGKFQSYTELLPQIVGKDGIPLQLSTFGGSVDAGVYDISIDFYTDSNDYFTPESRVVSLTVLPAEVEVVWDKLSFTYDGKSKSPTAHFIDLGGNRVNLSVVGAATNAGQDYIATASLVDSNYVLKNTKTAFEIKKADYDMSLVKWSADSFIYNGSKRSVTLSGLPSGVSVVSYSGDKGSEAGKYVASVSLSWDKVNYNPPKNLTHEWEILPAEYDMSGVRFDSAVVIYDGKIHYPELNGVMPKGADGISLEYSFSAGARHVSDGAVSVIISFKTNSKNYVVPSDRFSSVRIIPLGIEVEWGVLNLVYNGEEQAPTAFSDKCTLKVLGGKTSTGRYIANTLTDNSDYYIINDSAEYTIERANNSWTVSPCDSECYEGREIKLTGKSKFGKITYTFYSDPEGKNKISTPTDCGRYYAVLTVSATENYDGLRSDVVCFNIVPILPISFLAEITDTDIHAFDKLLSSDYICTVVNNDGSLVRVDSHLVKVVYENSDSFRRADSFVTFKYDQFSITVPVEVKYADYDLSDLHWEYTRVIYDGQEKSPALSGLPSGIEVVEYIGSGVKDAGSYKIYASVKYDMENYNQPTIPVCNLVIEKCQISIPYITAVYNGEAIIPMSDSPLYTVVAEQTYVDSGKYAVTVKIKDEKNYIFKENLSSVANAVFEIKPAVIFVTVADVKLHLFEILLDVDYTINNGSVLGDDILTVSAYREGKSVLIRSENPNYVLQVEAGRLIRLPYPTAKGGVVLLCIAVTVALMVSAIKAVYINREKINTAVAMAKCKWQNRSFKAPEPREMKGIRSVLDDKKQNELIEKISKADLVNVKNEEFGNSLKVLDFDVDVERADMLITDSLAKSLIKKEGEVVYTNGNSRSIINVDTLSDNFLPGERIDINSLKSKGLLDDQVSFIKVLARGRIDKPIRVYANEFSLSAVKMIALMGGQSIKVISKPKREKE